MAALWGLPGAFATRIPPQSAKSDDVYPVHMLDDTKTLRGIIFAWTLRFSDVLDADKLYASLSRLLELEDWRKESGELEIHAPRPAVSYTHQALAMDIEDHPLANAIPKTTKVPSIQPEPHGFRAFAAREDAPATPKDFIYRDTPQLSLHITSFNNATLVALSLPHTLMDFMGQQALLRS